MDRLSALVRAVTVGLEPYVVEDLLVIRMCSPAR